MTAHGLIDTTEMYLRTIFELEEEGIVPLRARIAERLQQSGPTVSQTVARMERDGLVRVEGDRHLAMTDNGRQLAVRVMRKHRLAECLLVNVIGLPWEQVHVEACRWEHVMSEEVERRLVMLLDNPTVSPYGNPIPGLDELGVPVPPMEPGDREPMAVMSDIAGPGDADVVVRRIGEHVQNVPELMSQLVSAGIRPGHSVTLAMGDEGVRITQRAGGGTATAELPDEVAAHVFVAKR